MAHVVCDLEVLPLKVVEEEVDNLSAPSGLWNRANSYSRLTSFVDVNGIGLPYVLQSGLDEISNGNDSTKLRVSSEGKR